MARKRARPTASCANRRSTWPRPPSRWIAWTGWAAAALLAAVLITPLVLGPDENEPDVWRSIVADPTNVVTALAPTPDGSPELQGRVTYDADQRRAAFALQGYVAGSTQDYQLWAILEGEPVPVSLGLIQPDSSGVFEAVVDPPGDASVAAFAVSLEPEGGAPAGGGPTGAVVAVGSLAGP